VRERANCVHACPKGIPLTESIAEVIGDAWKQALLRLACRVTGSSRSLAQLLADPDVKIWMAAPPVVGVTAERRKTPFHSEGY